MYANLFGDFVKGKDLTKYSLFVQSGIKRHRSIDSFIDNHPTVLDLLHELYPKLPKVSGIAIDLFFDHCLAKSWSNYHPTDYFEFLSNFYQYKPKHWDEYPLEFKEFIAKMRKYKWLNYYHTMEGLQKACEGVSKRISFETQLPHAPSVFSEKQQMIEIAFDVFMQDAKQQFENNELKEITC
jgi:acyl carrier protein phosphodiesterase